MGECGLKNSAISLGMLIVGLLAAAAGVSRADAPPQVGAETPDDDTIAAYVHNKLGGYVEYDEKSPSKRIIGVFIKKNATLTAEDFRNTVQIEEN